MLNCEKHPHTQLICPACTGAAGGAAGRGISTPRKAASSRNNGRLGGRPKLPLHIAACTRKSTGSWDVTCPGCTARSAARKRARQ
jgi:hypothetical protein